MSATAALVQMDLDTAEFLHSVIQRARALSKKGTPLHLDSKLFCDLIDADVSMRVVIENSKDPE